MYSAGFLRGNRDVHGRYCFKELYNLVGTGRIKREIQKVTQMEILVD